MSTFSYTAINAQGAELKGELHAPDLEAARDLLRQRGLLPQRIDSVGRRLVNRATFRKKVDPKALQIFSRQFATLIEAGVSVVTSLTILADQTVDKNLTATIEAVRGDVESGMILSKALSQHPNVFDRLYVSMVEAGEASGMLDRVLDRLAVQIEKTMQIKRRVKGAMIYPIVVMCFATLALFGMLIFLVPVFVKIFAQLNGQLPTLTQMVVDVSDILRGYWYIIFPLMVGAFFGFRKWKKTERGRELWDSFKLRIPMKIGDVVLKVTMARFSRTLATLVGAGVDIVKALEITGNTSGNWVVEQALAEVRVKVHEGIPIAQPLIENPVFPPMVSQMIKIGEETGELEKMLGKIADFYEDEVETSINALTSIIEPLTMIAVGVMVGIIVIAMYLPMFKMMKLVNNSG
ncbi:MAG TPA: type II secretion system F family protein [Gaiellaceae bacterium]|nr:type II secretion system F family protein [Gaiellaceae bacterium]